MKRFRNILASVDTQQSVHPTLEWAAALAEANGARLKIMDVARDLSWPEWLALRNPDQTRERLVRERREQLETLARPLRDKGLAVAVQAACGKRSVELIAEVNREQHDLVVEVAKGAHSRREGFFGNTAWRLFRHCPCAVWVVRPDAPPRFQRILAAVDPVPHDLAHAQLNKTIVELARSIAQYAGGEFEVIHAWSLIGEGVLRAEISDQEFHEVETAAQAQVHQAMERFLADYNLSLAGANVHLVKGDPAQAIPEFANRRGVDLVILGTVARSGLAGMLMGNTAEAVLSELQCAVLALKPEGLRSLAADE